MLTHPTLDQMHQLGLAGMARAFTELEANPQSADLSHAEWLGLLLDREATERYERRLRARLRYARLRHQAAVEDVDYRAPRGLDRALFQALIAARWIDEAQNLIIEGPAGVGKSWLACALGHKACRDNRSVLYQRAPRMFGDLALARGDGRYPRLMRALGGVKLLILDDWGLEPLGPEQRHDMLEIVEDRYGRGATLITSQIPVDRWHDLIGEPTLADAILDRIIHNAHRLQLHGDSLRKKALKIVRRLTRHNGLWRDHIKPAGDPPPRPTSIGTAGRLRSEQVADINRNARPASSESARRRTQGRRSVRWWGDDLGRWGRALGATDQQIRMIERFAGCFRDHRVPDLVEHSVARLVGQRVFGLALGYEDLIDHDELRHDPVMAVLAGKLAAKRADCAPLAGKSTLNRLELSRPEPTRYHKISDDAAAIEGLFVDRPCGGAGADHARP